MGILIVYHHVGYPILLRIFSCCIKGGNIYYEKRNFQTCDFDNCLPTVHLILPAYNEAENIVEKIKNISTLDYPENKLKVTLICDGCTDNTAKLARLAHSSFECQHLDLEIIEKTNNEGKISVINQAILSSPHEIIALSDISALISIDALLIASSHFKVRSIGVVSGTYSFLNPSTAGEEIYWKYQTAIKRRESKTGSTLGVHGAFYLFRRRLFSPLTANTINDDFILPMSIVEKGYKAVYEPRINAVELEQASSATNQNRRRRIAAGNVQQFIKLWRLIHPKYKGIAFNFVSGKLLRILMPFCLLGFLLGSVILSAQYTWMIPILLLQVLVYGVAWYRQTHLHRNAGKLEQTIHYIVTGYAASFLGICSFLAGKEIGAWKKSNISEDKV